MRNYFKLLVTRTCPTDRPRMETFFFEDTDEKDIARAWFAARAAQLALTHGGRVVLNAAVDYRGPWDVAPITYHCAVSAAKQHVLS